MPCNDPTVNLGVLINTKSPLTNFDALKEALRKLEELDGAIVTKTQNGYEVTSPIGTFSLVLEGDKYIIKGTPGQRAAMRLGALYESVIIETVLIEEGYMTDVTPVQRGAIEIMAYRVV